MKHNMDGPQKLRERNQTRKAISNMLTFRWHSGKREMIGTENISIYQSLMLGEQDDSKGTERNLGDDRIAQYFDCVMVTWLVYLSKCITAHREECILLYANYITI